MVNPDAICIDYEVNPLQIIKEIKVPIQGGMDPKVLLTDKEVVINNIPDIIDVNKLIDLLKTLGVKIKKISKGSYSFIYIIDRY